MARTARLVPAVSAGMFRQRGARVTPVAQVARVALVARVAQAALVAEVALIAAQARPAGGPM